MLSIISQKSASVYNLKKYFRIEMETDLRQAIPSFVKLFDIFLHNVHIFIDKQQCSWYNNI